jgi:MYXO-CTERM domain-containing protein
VTLIGVDAVAIPAPGALALLGVAGFASRRRRA